MKHFIMVGALVGFALIVRFMLFQHLALDIYIHDTYYVIPLRVIVFRLLLGIAVMWFVIAAYKFGRHRC